MEALSSPSPENIQINAFIDAVKLSKQPGGRKDQATLSRLDALKKIS